MVDDTASMTDVRRSLTHLREGLKVLNHATINRNTFSRHNASRNQKLKKPKSALQSPKGMSESSSHQTMAHTQDTRPTPQSAAGVTDVTNFS